MLDAKAWAVMAKPGDDTATMVQESRDGLQYGSLSPDPVGRGQRVPVGSDHGFPAIRSVLACIGPADRDPDARRWPARDRRQPPGGGGAMTTKAVADAELAALKAAMSDSAAAATGPEAAPRDGAANAANGSSEGQDAQSLQALLAEHGLTGDDMRTLLDQLSHELGDLPRNKPVLTALGAFALGFAAGRLSKQEATMFTDPGRNMARRRSRLGRAITVAIRAERVIARRRFAAIRQQTTLLVLAGLVAGIGVVMINIAAFIWLGERFGHAGGGAVLAGANFVLAALLALAAGRLDPDSGLEPIAELRDMAVEEIQAEADDAMAEARELARNVRAMARDPLGALAPGLIGPLLAMLTKATRK
jgi:hypothetical protein